jgi:hypothetical protein
MSVIVRQELKQSNSEQQLPQPVHRYVLEIRKRCVWTVVALRNGTSPPR